MDQHKIDILIATKVWNPTEWADRLNQLESVGKVHIWPTEDDLTNVKALFVWKPLDAHVLQRLPHIEWVSSLGAGVDHLVGDHQIPDHIPITRIVDPHLTRDMTNYVIMGLMMHQRSILQHLANQNQNIWDRLPYRNLQVGVLGLGELGAHCASHLAKLGFITAGYSRTAKAIEGVQCYAEGQREEFLASLDVLVNLLPVTPQTDSILNTNLFSQMKDGAYLINVARGNHLVEEDLIIALNEEKISGALLDVFREEPLPSHHPLWNHPKVMVTPHVASVSLPESVMNLLEQNINRLINGEELLHKVDRKVGY